MACFHSWAQEDNDNFGETENVDKNPFIKK